ncbi:MAG: SRPBCC family protein [Woeseiaceae bacterium]
MNSEQNQIEKIVDISAPVSKVWSALTDHTQFGEWFHVHLNEPFEVGATTTGHITYPGHEDMQWVSVTEELTPESRFAFSWPPSAVDPDTEYSADAKVMVVFGLEPTEQGTRLTITESGFDQFPEKKRLDVLRSNTEGWNIQAKNIADYVTK